MEGDNRPFARLVPLQYFRVELSSRTDRARTHTRPAIERALDALRALYPQGLPRGTPNLSLNFQVQDWLKSQARATVSNKTIGRAKKEYPRLT